MTKPSESTKLEGLGGFYEYVGSGKLKDKKALVTGGEYVFRMAVCQLLIFNVSSGIGRSVAILMAREGADITIVYLPSEQSDAEATKASVEEEQRSCLLIPGDLRERDLCRHAVDEHVKRSVIVQGYPY